MTACRVDLWVLVSKALLEVGVGAVRKRTGWCVCFCDLWVDKAVVWTCFHGMWSWVLCGGGKPVRPQVVHRAVRNRPCHVYGRSPTRELDNLFGAGGASALPGSSLLCLPSSSLPSPYCAHISITITLVGKRHSPKSYCGQPFVATSHIIRVS